jgi:carbon monoxide dehydrogenase subunit G
MRPIQPDERLVYTARARGVAEWEMAVSAEQLFATLEDGPSWAKWLNAIKHVTWTSPKPFGKGTTRTVTLRGGIAMDEVFSEVESPRRMSFSACGSNSAILAGLGEIYEVEPIGANRCRLRWTLAVKVGGPLAAAEPLLALGIPGIQRQLMKRLERVARDFTPPA